MFLYSPKNLDVLNNTSVFLYKFLTVIWKYFQGNIFISMCASKMWFTLDVFWTKILLIKAPFPYVRIRHPASGMRIRHTDPASGYSVSICTDITDIYRCNIKVGSSVQQKGGKLGRKTHHYDVSLLIFPCGIRLFKVLEA